MAVRVLLRKRPPRSAPERPGAERSRASAAEARDARRTYAVGRAQSPPPPPLSSAKRPERGTGTHCVPPVRCAGRSCTARSEGEWCNPLQHGMLTCSLASLCASRSSCNGHEPNPFPGPSFPLAWRRGRRLKRHTRRLQRQRAGVHAGRGTGGSTHRAPRITRTAVTLEYWSRWAQPTSEVEDKRITEWMSTNGPTKVERTSINPYLDKLNAGFPAGAGPDLYSVSGTGMAEFRRQRRRPEPLHVRRGQ